MKLSQDYYTFSPVLQAQLADKRGDIVIRPKSEAEVLRVARLCAAERIPLTVRGAGTGNYGQCVPLHGGVILDLSLMQKICWVEPGMACVEPGVKMAALDRVTRESGWELRMAPSTYRTATIGGFIGGGSMGMGSITYGALRDRGNINALRVVTLEDEPRVIELRGDEVQLVNHAYGTNGIITELEIPLGPTYPWAEYIVTFTDFMTAAHFGRALGNADGIIKKLIGVYAWPIPHYFGPFQASIPQGSHCAFLMVSESSEEALRDLVKAFGGNLVYQKGAESVGKGPMLLEYGWNHTTLHARNIDANLTYLQTLYPSEPDLAILEHLYHHFGDEVMVHLEFIRSNGGAVPIGLQVVRYSTPERLQEIMDYHEAKGALIFNPHTYVMEDGGDRQIDPAKVDFKEQVDPYGLLNPGKMRGWEERQSQ